jgi:hypothetical protein
LYGLSYKEFQFPCLVPTASQAGQIIPLYPQFRTNVPAEIRQAMYWGW